MQGLRIAQQCWWKIQVFFNMRHLNWWTCTSVLKELSSCIFKTVLWFLDFPKMEVTSYSTLLVTVSVYVVICSRRLGSSYMYNVACYMYIVLYKENEMIYYVICYSLIFGVSMLVCFLQDVILMFFFDRASWLNYILITNLMHKLLFSHITLHSSTCFEP